MWKPEVFFKKGFVNLFSLDYGGSCGHAQAFHQLPWAGSPLVASAGFLQWLLLFGAQPLAPTNFNSFGTGTQELWCVGLVAPPNVESSRARDQTCVLCIGRGIPSPWTTREVPNQKSQWVKSGSLEGQVDFEMIKLYHV